MSIEHIIRFMAGTFILVSLGLGYWIHEAFFIFTAFVGLNLLQSSVTKWCLAESLLKKIMVRARN